jgi:hypothetical protein
MTTEQRATAHDVSAATVHQALVARGRVMRVEDHARRAGDDRAEHCGFLFPEYESYVDQCGGQWTNYMARVLVPPSENAVAAASDLSNSGHQVRPAGYDEEVTQVPPDPRQGDLYA